MPPPEGKPTMQQQIEVIPAYKVEKVMNEIAKLNRKAKKLGCPELKLTLKDTDPKKVFDCPYTGRKLVNPYVIPMVEATVDYEIPNVDGYELVAKLDLYGDKVLISAVPDSFIPSEYLSVTSIGCDHCKTRRPRKHSVLLREIATGKHIEVGSTCVKDFFHGNDPKWMLHMASFVFSDIVGGIRDEDCRKGYGRVDAWDFISVLSYTAAVIRQHGWVSKAVAQEYDKKATAWRVHTNLEPPIRLTPEDKEDLVSIIDEDEDTVIATVKHWEAVDATGNSYLTNCKNLMEMGYVPHKYLGFACSMVSTYLRTLEEKKVKEAQPESNHIGTVGERLRGLKVKVLFYRHIDCDYSPFGKDLYTFIDEDGNIFKTFYSGSGWSLEDDEEAIIDGTVKRHDEWKGQKQTLLTRVSVK